MSLKHLDFQSWEIYIETSYSLNLEGNSYFIHADQGFSCPVVFIFQPSWVILSVRCGALLPYPLRSNLNQFYRKHVKIDTIEGLKTLSTMYILNF